MLHSLPALASDVAVVIVNAEYLWGILGERRETFSTLGYF